MNSNVITKCTATTYKVNATDGIQLQLTHLAPLGITGYDKNMSGFFGLGDTHLFVLLRYPTNIRNIDDVRDSQLLKSVCAAHDNDVTWVSNITGTVYNKARTTVRFYIPPTIWYPSFALTDVNMRVIGLTGKGNGLTYCLAIIPYNNQ